jgi:hypothetical protein
VPAETVTRATVAVFLAACSGPFQDDVTPIDASAFRPDATVDAATFDGFVDQPETTPFNGGGPFVCGNCFCDGTLDMCFNGKSKAPIDASDDASGDAGCNADAAQRCTMIPIECLPKPTCACIEQAVGDGDCVCKVDPSGNGFFVTCIPQP